MQSTWDRVDPLSSGKLGAGVAVAPQSDCIRYPVGHCRNRRILLDNR